MLPNLDHGYLQIIGALDNFRRQHIGGARDGRKKFEKQTQKFCTALDRYLNLSAKKPEEQTLRERRLSPGSGGGACVGAAALRVRSMDGRALFALRLERQQRQQR
ncbi:Rho GTPase-activating protein 26 [Amphibalanus amphitrite]|uniref:Rho GTPase-activating protein 26 n=1 Tax=Amphibalanus amphitrite TaxID=1232801 RepID=A0A6A4VQX2_AMPAM|nr:Rho GTPase-activating protein 26 [Amphibalanus amphitrite]